MRRSLPFGLFLFACVFVAYAVHLARAGGPAGFAPAVICVMGIAAAGVGLGLWRRVPWGLPAYGVWAACALALGFWQELTVRRAPLGVVIVWLILGALLYFAVGVYLHDALRPPRPQAG